LSRLRVRGPLCRRLREPGEHGRCIVLRAAVRGDIAAMPRLERAAALAEHRLIPDIAGRRIDARVSRRHWRRTVTSARRRLFVAVRGAELLGAIGVDLLVSRHPLAHVRRRIYLHSLFVQPAARRLGLARRLTRLALDWGRGRGAVQARLEMAAPNRAARGLYESLGFRVREMMFARPL
jgi:ribosomal protein S18 acetylase RimI-like enzyme